MLENTNGSTGTSPTRATVLQLRVAGAWGQPPPINWARVPRGPSCYMTSNSLSKSSPRTNDRLNEVPLLGRLGGVAERFGPMYAAGASRAQKSRAALWPCAWMRQRGWPRRWRDALIEGLHASSSIGQRTKLAGCPGRDISNGATKQPATDGAQTSHDGTQPAVEQPPARQPASE